jgi:hypothetical protein
MCDGADCAKDCHGSYCGSGCSGERCGIGCTGSYCAAGCDGTRCAAGCTGDHCAVGCTGAGSQNNLSRSKITFVMFAAFHSLSGKTLAIVQRSQTRFERTGKLIYIVLFRPGAHSVCWHPLFM